MPDAAPRIHLITDRRRLAPDAAGLAAWKNALERQVDEAALCGIDVVQLRERDLDARELVDLARALRRRVEGSSTMLVVNERADAALAAGAHGVHTRADGPSAWKLRTLGPAGWRVGRSIHGAVDARAHQDADYLIFGTVFASASKPGRLPAGEAGLAEVVKASAAPVIAIGGLSPKGAETCARAGAAGVAAIGLFLPVGREPGALGVRAAALALRAAFDHGRTGHVQ